MSVTQETDRAWCCGALLLVAAMVSPLFLIGYVAKPPPGIMTPVAGPKTTVSDAPPLSKWVPLPPRGRVIQASWFKRVTWKTRRKLTCTMIINGTLETFSHELAHCNGWNHPNVGHGFDPVDTGFYHAFNGRLVIKFADGADPTLVKRYAQDDAQIIVSRKSAQRLCDQRPAPGLRLLGCADLLPPSGKRAAQGVHHDDVRVVGVDTASLP